MPHEVHGADPDSGGQSASTSHSVPDGRSRGSASMVESNRIVSSCILVAFQSRAWAGFPTDRAAKE
jgi:hypothetical protein